MLENVNLYTAYELQLPPWPVIFDVGCSRGYESLKLWKLFGPKCTLVSIDPLQEAIDETQKLITKYTHPSLSSWITWRTALDIRDCERYYTLVDDNQDMKGFPLATSYTRYGEQDKYKQVLLPCSTLDTICCKLGMDCGPDIMKLDIEGEEFKVLPSIISCSDIKLLFIELHINKHTNHMLRDIVNQLESQFYLRWFEYRQNQTIEFDFTSEIYPAHVFQSANVHMECYFHVVAQRKKLEARNL